MVSSPIPSSHHSGRGGISSAQIPKEVGKCGLTFLLNAAPWQEEAPLRDLLQTLSSGGRGVVSA